MTTVRIPPVLRQHVGGARQVEIDGDTVGNVLQNLTSQHPVLKSQLFADGSLQPFVNVYLNDQDIQYLERLDTPVGPGDTIILLPAMAGGQTHADRL